MTISAHRAFKYICKQDSGTYKSAGLRCLLVMALSLVSAAVFSGPLTGVYTIGGSMPSYSTLTAAVSALNANGVSGPVTFNVRPGTYTGQVVVHTITGSSAANTVTFQSESGVAGSVTITYTPTDTTNDYVIYLSGASHVSFKNLTVTAVGDTFAKAFVLKNGSSNINFFGNILNCGLSAWDVITSMVIDASPGNGLNNDSIVLIGNQINGGSFGYESEGQGSGENTGLVIKNNTFSNSFYAAVNIAYCSNAVIQSNTFSEGTGYGISMLNHCDGILIEENNINAGLGYALYIDSAGTAGRPGLIANNFISAQVALSSQNCSYQLFYNNTIYAFEYSVLLRGGTGNAFENNIVYNYNTTGSAAIWDAPSGSFSVCDYNDYHAANANFGWWGALPCSNLAQWQAASGFDAHSRAVVPPFVSDSDLRLTTCDSLRFGIPLASVPYDIDSNLRSALTTVVGAYECPLPVSAHFTASDTVVCAGQGISFTDESANDPRAWHWTFRGGAPDTSSARNPAVVYDSAGVYSVKLVVANSLSTDSLTRTAYIVVHPAPVVTLSWEPLLQAHDLIIRADTIWCQILPHYFPMSGGTPSGGIYSGGNIRNDSFVFSSNFAVDTILYMYTDSNGCRGQAVDSFPVVICEGINAISGPDMITLYPNPATDRLYITTQGAKPETISIYDVNGRMLYTMPFKPDIDIMKLNSGVYFVEVTGEGSIARKRFVKM
jgi:PKD repeat protein